MCITHIINKSKINQINSMACNLPACTEKSTHPSSNTQPIVIGAIVGLGLLYYYFMPHSKRK